MGLTLNTFCLFLGCLLLATFREVAVAKTSVQARCPPDTLSLNGYCYQTFDDTLSWSEAFTVCSSLKGGSQLATLRNEVEMKILAEYMKVEVSELKAWIGLSKTKDRSWRWADGSRHKYKAWHYQPLPEGNYCAVLDTSSDPPVWQPEACDGAHGFICQFLP